MNEFEQHFECRILAVNRNGMTLLPAKAEQVQRGDVVIVEASFAILHHVDAPQFADICQVKLLKMKGCEEIFFFSFCCCNVGNKERSTLSVVQPWVILVLAVAMVVLAVFFDLLFAFAGVVALVAIAMRVITWKQALESVQGRYREKQRETEKERAKKGVFVTDC